MKEIFNEMRLMKNSQTMLKEIVPMRRGKLAVLGSSWFFSDLPSMFRYPTNTTFIHAALWYQVWEGSFDYLTVS